MNKYTPQKTGKSMSVRNQTRLGLAAIVLLAIVFSLIAYPTLPQNFPGSAFFNKYYPHLGLDLQGGTHLVYEADMTQIESTDKDSALEGVRDVIERRVNTLGVAEPVVQTSRQKNNYRVLVELAGVQDVNEAIKLIGETPLLQFKEVSSEPMQQATSSQQITEIQKRNQEKLTQAKDIISRIQKGEKFEDLSKQYSEDTAVKEKGGELGWVGRGIYTPVFEKAVFDEMKAGELRKEPLQTEFGYHIIKKLGERKNDKGETEVNAAHILIKTASVTGDQAVNWKETQLSGKHLKRAQVTFQPQTNQPEISLTFNSEGADLFKQITERNISKPVGIFLDNEVISAPTVQAAISGGQAVISGNFTLAEAKLLAQRLNAGALPVPVKLLSQQTVGPSLGQDSLNKSLYAGAVGLGLVAVFMVVYYLLPGVLAVLALLLYSILALGLFEMIPVTLTLAGIAGFILSIGMAVDANILIFERMKEELRRGASFATAIEQGFHRAWPSIRDSNVSSLITCVILYWFGTSIIRGFAVTLALGILVSMFSAITVTRTFLRLIINWKPLQKTWLFGVRNKHES